MTRRRVRPARAPRSRALPDGPGDGLSKERTSQAMVRTPHSRPPRPVDELLVEGIRPRWRTEWPLCRRVARRAGALGRLRSARCGPSVAQAIAGRPFHADRAGQGSNWACGSGIPARAEQDQRLRQPPKRTHGSRATWGDLLRLFGRGDGPDAAVVAGKGRGNPSRSHPHDQSRYAAHRNEGRRSNGRRRRGDNFPRVRCHRLGLAACGVRACRPRPPGEAGRCRHGSARSTGEHTAEGRCPAGRHRIAVAAAGADRGRGHASRRLYRACGRDHTAGP